MSVAALVALLAACDGGGGSASSAQTPVGTSSPATESAATGTRCRTSELRASVW
ncbi:hypothetical protein [Streptomyces dysideae]|uniref:hypothetical protein n=1 Tax=Streptomyces dysideae TaxID=909626 RepID=UPI00131D1F22|nr:hypothetical protein [Streptomyces dysideae]